MVTLFEWKPGSALSYLSSLYFTHGPLQRQLKVNIVPQLNRNSAKNTFVKILKAWTPSLHVIKHWKNFFISCSINVLQKEMLHTNSYFLTIVVISVILLHLIWISCKKWKPFKQKPIALYKLNGKRNAENKKQNHKTLQ